MTCLRKEDSKISFLLIYATGFCLEPKNRIYGKFFFFPIYPVSVTQPLNYTLNISDRLIILFIISFLTIFRPLQIHFLVVLFDKRLYFPDFSVIKDSPIL